MAAQKFLGSLLIMAFALPSCKHTEQTKLSSAEQSPTPSFELGPTSQPKLCAAVRGNGPLIWGHFGALARILETEGLVDGIAGGSSGSITSFLYESVLANPEIYQSCATGSCSRNEVAHRAAFLIKTFPFWLNAVGQSKEGQAVAHIFTVAKELKSFDVSKLDATLEADIRQALTGLYTLLSSSTARSLINKEFLSFILPLSTDSLSLLKFRAAEAKKELQSFGKFEATSPDILLRPGLIDFRGVAEAIGRMADFYAGYAPSLQGEWSKIFATCTESSLQKTPWDIVSTPCGEKFRNAIALYFSRIQEVRQHRVNDTVGAKIPALASTATLVANQDLLDAAKETYRAGKGAALSLPLESVVFGYASSSIKVQQIKAGIVSYPDERSQRFLALGPMTWGDILAISPAEPGLAEALPFQDASGQSYSSFGGWSDLSPVMVMQSLGCERVIFVTRQGADSKFASGVAELVGLGPVKDDLFSLSNPESSFSQALNRSDMVYCTNWDAYNGLSEADIQRLFLHAYQDGKIFRGDRAGAPLGCAKVP